MSETDERRFFGAVTVGVRGQMVLPKEAREYYSIKPGDKLVVVGRGKRGIMLMKGDKLKEFAENVLKSL